MDPEIIRSLIWAGTTLGLAGIFRDLLTSSWKAHREMRLRWSLARLEAYKAREATTNRQRLRSYNLDETLDARNRDLQDEIIGRLAVLEHIAQADPKRKALFQLVSEGTGEDR